MAEQEGETGQVGAQGGQVVAVDADEAAEGGGELRVVGSGEPLADEGEGFGEFGGVRGQLTWSPGVPDTSSRELA